MIAHEGVWSSREPPLKRSALAGREVLVAIAWSCLMPLATYAKLARQAPAPRGQCPKCATQMAFDGGYFRQVREAGTVHRVFIHRARCASSGCAHALLPDFILRRRLDSTRAVGAAVLVGVGVMVGSTCGRGTAERGS